MNSACKNCGRNTATVTDPIEWKEYVFCGESCYSSFLQSKGIKKRKPDHPIKKKKILDRINDLPTPLKVVVWLNLVLAAVSTVESLAYMTSVPLSTNIENAFGILISVLIVVGIMQASRFIRIFVLICSWITAIMLGIAIPFALMHIGLQALLGIITFAVSVVTIWGLSANRSKAYFGY